MKGKTMGIEQNLERIAASLEKLAFLAGCNNVLRDRITRCAEFHAERAGMKDVGVAGTSDVEGAMADAEVAVEPETPAAEPEFTYDELKAKLIERGVEIPKGTKMTTLVKLWAANSDKPVIPPAPVAPIEPEVVEEAPAEADPFDTPAEPAKPAISDDLTLEEARAIIEKHYDRSEADKANLIAAFAAAGQGISNFGAIPAGKHGAVVRKFLELKGVAL
jgi:hypothetical protein